MIDFKINKDYKYLKEYKLNPDGSFLNYPSKDKFKNYSYKTKISFLKSINLLPIEIHDKDYKFTETKLNSLYDKYYDIYKKYGKFYKINNGIKYNPKKEPFKDFSLKNWNETKKYISDETGFPDWLSENILFNFYLYTFNQEANADRVLIRDLFIENSRPYDGVIYRGLSFDMNKKFDDFMDSIQKEIKSEFMGIKQNLSWTYSEHVAEYFSIGWSSIAKQSGDVRVLFKCINNLTGIPIRFLSDSKNEDEIMTKSNAIWDIVEIEKSENPIQELILVTCVERPIEKQYIDAGEIKKENMYFKEFLTVKAVKDYKVKASSKSEVENWMIEVFVPSANLGVIPYEKLPAIRKKLYEEYEESKAKHEYEKIHKEYIDIMNKW